MSTHPSSNSLGQALKLVLIAGGVLLFVFIFANHKHTAPPPQVRAHTAQPAPQPARPAAPPINPIEQQLAAPANVTRSEGIAVAVLMDVSGSMEESVRDSDGSSRPKIDIARRSMLELMGKTDAFARQHPDTRILLGIYEFSGRSGSPSCRKVIPLQAPDMAAAKSAIARMQPRGNTPIGDSIITAKRDLDSTGLTRMHILVVTDGDNNQGYAPANVVNVITQLEESRRASIYFIAFDVAAEKFRAVRDNGGLVLPAANAQELQQTLDYVLTGKILAEQPTTATP